MSEHTPGPWVIYDMGYYDWPRSPFNPWWRALVTTPKPDGSSDSVKFGHQVCKVEAARGSHDQGKADARLIAAAPDLLEALEQISNDHAAMAGVYDDCTIAESPGANKALKWAQDIAREAIKKTTG